MHKDQLLELRSKIVSSAQEIALNGNGSPDERLQVLLTIIRDGAASLDILAKTYELIQQGSVDDDKLNALLDLLYEVDEQLGVLEQSEQPASGSNDQTINDGEHVQQ